MENMLVFLLNDKGMGTWGRMLPVSIVLLIVPLIPVAQKSIPFQYNAFYPL
jgi:hypothetical protein